MIDGASSGRVTCRKARARDAPSMRAASSRRGSRFAQNPPTVRTTTATLKNTCATSIGATPALPVQERQRAARAQQREERGRDHDRRQHERHRHERAEQRGGRGSRSARRRTRPGSPTTSVRTVETTACQNVNHATRRNDGIGDDVARSRPAAASGRRSPPSGHTKNSARNPTGTATARAARHAPLAPPAHRTTRSVHSLIQSLRLAEIVAGSIEYGCGGSTAHLVNAAGSLAPVDDRVHVHLQRHVLLEPARQHEVDEGLRAGHVVRAVQHSRELRLTGSTSTRCTADLAACRGAGSNRSTSAAGSDPYDTTIGRSPLAPPAVKSVSYAAVQSSSTRTPLCCNARPVRAAIRSRPSRRSSRAGTRDPATTSTRSRRR